jgi:hypothetical protein
VKIKSSEKCLPTGFQDFKSSSAPKEHSLVSGKQFEKESFRIYILISPEFKWQSRITLNDENFTQYINREGSFARPKKLKLYITHSELSPDGSPAWKYTEGNPKSVDEKSEASSSHGTGRSGQADFSAAVRWRDRNTCVFCGTTDGKLEAAHILPVRQKELLNMPDKREYFSIGTINEISNGILLCWNCHTCFDANLVCIDADNGTLVVADALLANEERWVALKGREVSASSSRFWPSKQLLKFREDALRSLSATGQRHKMQGSYSIYC